MVWEGETDRQTDRHTHTQRHRDRQDTLLVTDHNPEDSAVEDDLSAHIEILHGVECVIAGGGQGDAVSANQSSLGNPRVELWGFVDLHRVVHQVEIDGAATDTKLLFSFLLHGLLEVGVEPQHLRMETWEHTTHFNGSLSAGINIMEYQSMRMWRIRV